MKHQAKALAVITTWTIYHDVFSQEGVCAWTVQELTALKHTVYMQITHKPDLVMK